MNFQRGLRREEPEINFIPLIDLLLVILIFLMITTTYTRFTELEVELPAAASQEPERRPVEIVVSVTADGRYLVDDQAFAPRDAADFAARLADAAGGREQPVVVINADAGATHQAVVNVLEAARLAGMPRVTFAAQAPPGQ